MKIYCAGQMSGKSGDEVIKYFTEIKSVLTQFGYTVFVPTTGKPYLNKKEELVSSGYKTFPVSTDHAVVERDRWMVSTVDVVFVNLLGTKMVSIGSVSEMAWAHQLGKHCVLAMEEGNIHTHAFINEFADIRFNTYEDAIAYLKELHN